jgi:hypothetical protein
VALQTDVFRSMKAVKLLGWLGHVSAMFDTEREAELRYLAVRSEGLIVSVLTYIRAPELSAKMK